LVYRLYERFWQLLGKRDLKNAAGWLIIKNRDLAAQALDHILDNRESDPAAAGIPVS
jgi:hypothetical protein